MTDAPEHSMQRDIVGDPNNGESKFKVWCKCGWEYATALKHRKKADKKAYKHFWHGNVTNKQRNEPMEGTENNTPVENNEPVEPIEPTEQPTIAPPSNTARISVGDQVHENEAGVGGGGTRRDGIVLQKHDATGEGDNAQPEALTIGWFESVTRVDADSVTAGASVDHDADEA